MTDPTQNLPPILATSNRPEGAQKILAGAADVFSRRGYSAASVRQLAEAAKMSIPMMYYYFESKEAVFEALMDEAMRYVRQTVIEPAMEAPPRQALEMYIKGHVHVALANPLIIRTVFAAFFGPEEGAPPIRQFKTQMHDQQMQWLVGLVPRIGRLRAGFDALFVAMLIDRLQGGLMMSVRHLDDPKFADFRPLLEASLTDEAIDLHIQFLLMGAYDEVFDGI